MYENWPEEKDDKLRRLKLKAWMMELRMNFWIKEIESYVKSKAVD